MFDVTIVDLSSICPCERGEKIITSFVLFLFGAIHAGYVSSFQNTIL